MFLRKDYNGKKTGCFAVSINTAAPQNGFLQGSCHSCTVLLWRLSCLQKKRRHLTSHQPAFSLWSQVWYRFSYCASEYDGAYSAHQLLKEQLTQKFQASKQGCCTRLGTCFKKLENQLPLSKSKEAPKSQINLKRHYLPPQRAVELVHQPWRAESMIFFCLFFSPLNAVLLESFSLHSSCIQVL